MLAEAQRRRRAGQQILQQQPALIEREGAEILAVEVQQVEGVEEGPRGALRRQRGVERRRRPLSV